MNALVVLFALASVACGSLVPLAQPPHHPALVLDPHGRPLDTAEVINARALHLQAKALEHHDAHLVHAAVAPVVHSIAPAVVPAAVSHQSRVDIHSSPAIVSHAITTPVLTHSAIAHVPVLTQSTLGHEHFLKKRSVALVAPSAVSHQARVDVISKPTLVSHAVIAPILRHSVATPFVTHAVAAPVVAVAPAAVSHQSRVDVHSSPAIVTHAISPLSAVWTGATYGAHSISHGHLLKKRSLAAVVTPVLHTAPAAVSHQSRVDVISEPAVVSHEIATPLAAAPLAHSAIWTAPVAHLGYFGLFKGLW